MTPEQWRKSTLNWVLAAVVCAFALGFMLSLAAVRMGWLS
jgi:hypothetical protein